jgi:acetyltransferase-like isoleucine patch superfamily enzyme
MSDANLEPSPRSRLKEEGHLNHKTQVAPSTSGYHELAEDFRHPQALVEAGASIGRGTRIWACAHVLAGATIGDACNICDHTFIEGGVRVGNRVTIKCGVYLWDGMTIEDDVFIGPGAVFTNDYRPRSRRHLTTHLKTQLREGCSIGANSTTLPNLVVGRWAMVGAGAVVTRAVPDYALVVGNPARFRAWICRCGEKLSPAAGRLLKCICGRLYEQALENEVKEFAANGSHLNSQGIRLATEFVGATFQPSGHHSGDGRSAGIEPGSPPAAATA